MKIRHPLIVTLFVGVLVTATLVGWIAANKFASETRSARRVDVTHLLDAVSSWSVALNRSLSDELTALINKEWNAQAPARVFASSEFRALALVTPNENGNWNINWWRSRVPNITQDWAQNVLQQSSGFPLKPGDVFWQRLLLPNQEVLFASAVPMRVVSGAKVKNRIAVGFAGPGLFALAPFADPSGRSNLFVVNQAGIAVGYPEVQYVGSDINAHPVVADMIAAPSAEKIETFSIGYKKAIGGYEHVPNSNLYVVATRTLPDWIDILAPAFLPAFEIAAVAALLLALIAAMVLGFERRERALLKEKLRLAKTKAAAVVEANTKAETQSRVEAPNQQKTADSLLDQDDLLRGIVDFLRGPVIAMSGYLQVLESHLTGSTPSIKAVNTHRQLSDIVKSVREFVEFLGRETRSSELKLDAIDLSGLLNAVIAVKKPALTKQSVQIEDNFQPDLRVKADFTRLKSAFATLLGFAGEYLSDSSPDSDRRLKLSAQKLGGMAQFRIEACGRELTPEIRRKLFAPFQIKANKKGGLDLALARARINEMNGEVTVEPVSYNGFQIVCKIPAAISETPAELKSKAVPPDIAQILPPSPDESDSAASENSKDESVIQMPQAKVRGDD